MTESPATEIDEAAAAVDVSLVGTMWLPSRPLAVVAVWHSR